MFDLAKILAGRLSARVARHWRSERGQTLVEYGLILAFVALLVIVAILFLKDRIAEFFSEAGNSITS